MTTCSHLFPNAGTSQAAGFDLFPPVPATCSAPVPMRRNRSEQVSDFASTSATCSRGSRAYGAEPGTGRVGRAGELQREPGADA